jgi:hypothetical protein
MIGRALRATDGGAVIGDAVALWRPLFMMPSTRVPRCSLSSMCIRDHASPSACRPVVTTEIYANASSAATRDALRQLEDILHSRF